MPWLTLRGVYEHAKRVGSGLDEQVLDDIGEQRSLRQFDISDRTDDRVSAVVMVIPTASLSFNGSVTAARDNRPDARFGLLNGATRSASIGVDFVPRDAIAFGASYVYETYGTLQRSRQANPGPQFNDPTAIGRRTRASRRIPSRPALISSSSGPGRTCASPTRSATPPRFTPTD